VSPWGWGAPPGARGKNPALSDHPGTGWQDGAGGLLLLAAAAETGGLAALEAALPAHDAGLARTPSPCRRMLSLTLLFLGAVGLRRTWDLRGYAGDGLALLTGRRRAYSYRHTERFLAALACGENAETLTDALAAWTTALWRPPSTLCHRVDASSPSFYYVDGHRKPVYADRLIPRGLVARRGTVLGCRALTVLHDGHGHPLLALTDRGDLHLTTGAPHIITRYERVAGHGHIADVIIDREGMAAEFIADLVAEGRTVATVLRSDQYRGLSSFTDVGTFVPLRYDRHGTLVREVAPARFSLARGDASKEPLALSVALVRDLRRRIACAPSDDEAGQPWDADLGGDGPRWWEEGWHATPATARPTEAKLIPIVSTAAEVDAVALAEAYFHRWPAQENAIRDWLIPLGIDTNHGYAKAPVENSEVAKRRAALEKRLGNVRRWAGSARLRCARASRSSARLYAKAKARSRELYQALNAHQDELMQQGVEGRVIDREIKAEKAVIDAEVEQHRALEWRAHTTSNQEWRKHEGYCREQRDLLRQLEGLAASERTMHELDNRKDQVMTVYKVALANLALWTRDRYFPATYSHATWQRLAPFFRLPGRVTWGSDTVYVELRPFNDRPLNRDLAAVCARVQDARPRLPDGRRLVFTLPGQRRPVLHAQRRCVA